MSAVNELANPRAVAGDNSPRTIDLAAEDIDKEIQAADQWASVVAIADAAQADRAKDAVDHLAALWKKYDEQRAAERKPHADAAKAVQERWKPLLSRIETCLATVKRLHDRWLDAENRRLAAARRAAQAEAERLAREAEKAAAKVPDAAPPSAVIKRDEAAAAAKAAADRAAAIPDRARTHGNYGAPARSLRTVWVAEVTDITKAVRVYRDHPEMKDLLGRLATHDIRAAGADRSDAAIKAWAMRGFKIYSRQE